LKGLEAVVDDTRVLRTDYVRPGACCIERARPDDALDESFQGINLSFTDGDTGHVCQSASYCARDEYLFFVH
jgi:hypothetical protein